MDSTAKSEWFNVDNSMKSQNIGMNSNIKMHMKQKEFSTTNKESPRFYPTEMLKIDGD